MKLVIGNKAYSSWSLRPWIALKQIGAPFEEILVPLDQPDTKARIQDHSPAGKVPVLIDNGIAVWESLAILEYLAERFPEAGLWPQDRAARAHARAIASEMHAGFQALRRHYPMNVRKHIPGRSPTPEAAADIARIKSLWQNARTRFGGSGPFLFGAFTAADAMYAPVASRFRTYDLAGGDAAATAYVEAIHALPAMAEWVAAGHAEPWVLAHDEVTADA